MTALLLVFSSPFGSGFSPSRKLGFSVATGSVLFRIWLNGKKEKYTAECHSHNSTEKRKKHVRGPENNTDSASIKCEACNYKCDKYVALQKHRKTNPGLIKCEINQKSDRSSVGDTATPDPLLHAIPSCGHRQQALVATADSGLQKKFYQLGIRYKRSHKITPLLVPEPPSSPPTRPALSSTTFHQILVETIRNHKNSRETGRHHEVRLTNLGGHNNRDIPSVDWVSLFPPRQLCEGNQLQLPLPQFCNSM